MASVSVACSAISPSQMNTRLIALNIVVPLLRFLRLLFFQQDFLLENKLKLLVELLFVGGPNHRHAQFLQRAEDLGIDVERHEMEKNTAATAFGGFLDAWHNHDRIRADSVLTVRDH